MKARAYCLPSHHIAGPCDACKQRADPAHIYTEADGQVKLFCLDCCPIHGKPLFTLSAPPPGTERNPSEEGAV